MWPIEVAASNGLGEFTIKYIIWLFTLIFGVKVTQNFAQYPLHHVAHAPAIYFEVAIPNGLGEYKNCDGQTMEQVWYEINTRANC